MSEVPKKPEAMTAEELIALGFVSHLREHDAVVDLRDQYAAHRAAVGAGRGVTAWRS